MDNNNQDDEMAAAEPDMMQAALHAVAAAVFLRVVLVQLQLYGYVLLGVLRQGLRTAAATPSYYALNGDNTSRFR